MLVPINAGRRYIRRHPIPTADVDTLVDFFNGHLQRKQSSLALSSVWIRV